MKKYYFPVNGKSNEAAVIRGNHYRITVLTPSLLRLEYSKEDHFEDRATQSVIDRSFEVPAFEKRTEKKNRKEWLIIETEKLLLRYDQKAFSSAGLSVTEKELGTVWHFGDPVNDLKGTYRTLDRVDGDEFIDEDLNRTKLQLGPAVISRAGVAVIDDSASMALTDDGFVEPRKPCTDLYFFGYGHRYLEALNDFYHLCGKTPLLPRFALGNWWSRYYRYTEAEYMKLMDRFTAVELPFSVAVIDMDWHLVDDVDPKYGSGWTGYTWNKNFFPDPGRFLAWLHQKNMKVTLNVHPADGIRAFEEIYPKMAEAMGVDPASEQPIEFDPADPVFMEQYFDVLCHTLDAQGVDFWWVDWQQGTGSRMPGLDPLWMLNHFHYLDSKWKGTRGLTFSRYAGVGSHRYPIGFSGDTVITWDSLRYQPYFTNCASNIGYGWWSHDIGGHMWGERDDELMARWLQLGVFSPINRLHSSNNPFTGKEPWKYNAVTRETMNRYLRLRHAMIPYLYTMNRRASRENLPLIEPMYYQEPEREEAYRVPNEYYFGTELLVSPVTEKTDKVSRAAKTSAWLPEGTWCDFFTGVVYEGGKMKDFYRPADDIPVLMKAGAIVPMTDMTVFDNSVSNPAAMEVRIFPAANGSFCLWEDDGDSAEDCDENWASTKLAYCRESAEFSIGAAEGNLSVLPEKRSWKLVFYAVPPEEAGKLTVTADGKKVRAKNSYDEEHCLMTVSVPKTAVTAKICVRFETALVIRDNRLQQCFKTLERAQMDYELKWKIWAELQEGGKSAAAALKEKGLPASVRAALKEFV